MMHHIPVTLKENSYKITVGANILSSLGAALKPLRLGTDAVIVTNPGIQKRHGAKLVAGLRNNGFAVKTIEIAPGERSKSAQGAFVLLSNIARYDINKKIFIVAFGGGVIGDLAGFVAAIYKRGVPYVQVPTTLLAQIDSAIGGKTAIDLPVGKNLVGAFYQPKVVFSDIATLSTLDKRQIRNGLAEAVKYGIIQDKSLFEYIDAHAAHLLKADPKIFTEVVLRCSRIKARVITADEKETKGIRTILNFGHTVGHAIEAGAGYDFYHHGEAIALGMRVATDISCRLNLLSRAEAKKIGALLSKLGLPKEIRKVKLPQILAHMAHDKKFQAEKNKFVLATAIGRVKVVENVPLSTIKSAIKTYLT